MSEVSEDGPSSSEIQEAGEYGLYLYQTILDKAEASSHDSNIVLFATWTRLIQYLIESGWTPSDLSRELPIHTSMVHMLRSPKGFLRYHAIAFMAWLARL